ncbi:TPM domain-containing protein [Phaeodactylibacter sp.]|uniref:TPM domain-containing protein n=1 Tax=Phaeodactylibacter sp. TaxID=1940289 RepID=UPI0025E47D2E|nr:TPM domain-containing protein [Phaeodactylibacter sp.]MCI4649006.1 TPM domain-containing protein [Phaeodactylibacter sp.]MCI5092447.1 TPM domain-containing protein [Phaeodactylibacter sp.]
MIRFFQPEEEDRIIDAIQEAELNTSGEIRVHLEDNLKGDVLQAAQKTFLKLEMHKTEARNGVLIFIAPEQRKLAILGDKGINEKVPKDFWSEERDIMLAHFKCGNYADGVCAAVQQVGAKLKDFFPYQSDDENELPDDISYS